jgi:hypothetical protein
LKNNELFVQHIFILFKKNKVTLYYKYIVKFQMVGVLGFWGFGVIRAMFNLQLAE